MDEIHSLSLWIKSNLLRSASLWCFHSAVQRDPNLRNVKSVKTEFTGQYKIISSIRVHVSNIPMS